MQVLWIVLGVLFYEYASLRALAGLSQRRPTDVSLFEMKYPVLVSHLPFGHKLYHILIYAAFFGLAYKA